MGEVLLKVEMLEYIDMNKLNILIEGYAHPTEDGNYKASPTTSLIYHNGLKILVDPGANKDMLLDALAKEGVTTTDIDIVFLSHYHPDHFLNIRLFPDKDLYDGSMIWRNDLEIAYSGNIPGTEIQVISTPGHSPEDCSLLFIDDTLGKVCIAPDVFWWEDGKQETDTLEDLLNLIDPFATDTTALHESRKKVLALADWIVPGHGKMFKNELKDKLS